MQAAILSVKLPHLHKWTDQRRERADHYTEKLSRLADLKTPKIADGREHVWHLYVIKHEQRGALASHLYNNGVQTVINYPVALPFLPAYKRLGHLPEDFPNAFKNQSKILALPLYPEMSASHIEQVVNLIESWKI